ncbi:restriction endonuclease subunit S [Ligilactobacillus salivarius]|nr:restriction endonuclease subunit S [Ligilactobacillus salivarius]
MAKEEKKAPKLRFNGYTNDWERKELNNILKINSGRDYKQLNSGNIPVYGTGGYMLSVNDKLSDTDAVGIGRKGTIDKPLYLRAPFWTVDTLFYCTSKENSDVKFIYLLFQIINWKRYDESTGVPSLSKNTISSIKTYVPKVKEQDHISKLFFSLDNTLQLHERKCEELALIKKALLQKLFPKKDEIKPEVRYKNFSDAWEQRKISDIFTITRGQVLATTDTSEIRTKEMCFPVYSSQTKNDGLMGYYNKYLFDTAITWTTDGANAGTVNYRKGKFYSTNVNGVLLSNEGYVSKAVAEILNTVAWRYVSRVGNPKLMNNVMAGIVISIPSSFKEQNKISELLTDFDSLIALHHRKLEKLKQLKKFLLQNMFI